MDLPGPRDQWGPGSNWARGLGDDGTRRCDRSDRRPFSSSCQELNQRQAPLRHYFALVSHLDGIIRSYNVRGTVVPVNPAPRPPARQPHVTIARSSYSLAEIAAVPIKFGLQCITVAAMTYLVLYMFTAVLAPATVVSPEHRADLVRYAWSSFNALLTGMQDLVVQTSLLGPHPTAVTAGTEAIVGFAAANAVDAALLAPRRRRRHQRQIQASLSSAAAATSHAGTNRGSRIAEVHQAVAELDREWLDYELDTYAYFLAKPQLRNNTDPVVSAYRQAHAALRDHADALTDTVTDEQIAAAQDAARRALKAWGEANRHALAIGATDLSPTEEAALHTLHGLVNQLNDRCTPKSMWPQLVTAISRTLPKLATVPTTLAVIAQLPRIGAETRMQALQA